MDPGTRNWLIMWGILGGLWIVWGILGWLHKRPFPGLNRLVSKLSGFAPRN